ncbi:hypothetical protein [Legionella yabuuchiae]|uniref:hypothetical protein n=1 Tax=Legionella yabuuchiae TaxID=376727 RepID=UPI0013EFA7FE|nr:hypothetical protein [Legionella yabuuchiae]
MRKVFRLLGIIAEAIFDIAEDKPVKNKVCIFEARRLYESGSISMEEYNEAFEADK